MAVRSAVITTTPERMSAEWDLFRIFLVAVAAFFFLSAFAVAAGEKTDVKKKPDAEKKTESKPEKKPEKPQKVAKPDADRFRELRECYRDNPAKAVKGFKEFPTRFPQSDWNDDAQYWLAMSLARSRAPRAEIIKAYRELIDDYPKSGYRDDAFFNIAEIYRYRSRTTEDRQQAMVWYRKFIKNFPRSKRLSEAYMKIADTQYYHIRNYKKAEEAYLVVVEKFPTSAFVVRAQRRLAQTYVHMKRIDDALRIYTNLLKQDIPEKVRIRARLGVAGCYLRQKDGEAKAVKEYEDIREEANKKKSLEDYAEYVTREKMAAYLLRKRQYDKAEGEYQAYLERFGKSAGIWQAKLNIAKIRFSAGKFSSAREMFQTITTKHPLKKGKYPWYAEEAHYYEAYTFEMEKNFAEAKRLYKKLIDVRKRSHRGRLARKRLEEVARKEKQAAEEAKKKDDKKEPAEKR